MSAGGQAVCSRWVGCRRRRGGQAYGGAAGPAHASSVHRSRATKKRWLGRLESSQTRPIICTQVTGISVSQKQAHKRTSKKMEVAEIFLVSVW